MSSKDAVLVVTNTINISSLPIEILSTILSLAGKKDYRYLTPVCKAFQSSLRVHSKLHQTCWKSVVASVTRTKIFLAEIPRNDEIQSGWDMVIRRHRFAAVAASIGNIQVLQLLIDTKFLSPTQEFYSYVCEAAAAHGHLETLQFARKHGFQWNAGTCIAAASNHHFQVLKWSVENGCPLNSYVSADAALKGQLKILKWLIDDAGCPFDQDSILFPACAGTGIGTCTGKNEPLEVVKWLREEKECEWTSQCAPVLIRRGDLEIIQWAKAHGCHFDTKVCTLMARASRRADIVHWLEENCEE